MIPHGCHVKQDSVEFWYFSRLVKPVKDNEEGPELERKAPTWSCKFSDDLGDLARNMTADTPATPATMDQGNFEEQLSMVQQMVQEMKQGFTTAMEELSKIQYGDQTLQKQLADTKQECKEDIKDIQQAVKDIKLEVQKIAAQVREVTTAQKDLRERVESYQDDKTVLLDELEKSGIISSDSRMRLQMRLGADQHREDNTVPEVTTMVNTYLDSIQPHTAAAGDEDQYQSDSSLTATVSRNMGLTQALGEKCLHLDLSASSEEEEEEQEPPHFSPHPDVHRQGSFHREEVAHDIVEAERDYCSQLWTLMDTFINPLRQREILTSRDLNRVFPPYMPQLYEQHCIMLHKLEDRLAKWKWNGIVGDVFAKLTDSQDSDSGLALYRFYINDFPTIINSMNRWFAQSTHFREIMQSTCMATSPVLTLLLAPLHQVPKYSLLIKSMLKWTSADHPDRYYLEMSLSRLKLFLKNMNDELEHAMQVLNIGSNNDGDGPSHRSQELGNSMRSQSSGSSSIEANPASTTKDSGIQSNGEDVLRGHLSPTFNQRFLQQTLKERQQALDAEHRKESNLVHPRPHQLAYGSQPNLSQPLIVFDTGRNSPYMFSNPNKKLYSSQTKLHLPFDRSEKAKLKKRSDGQKMGPHSSHMRPLTPQILSYTRNRNFPDGRVHLREGGSGRGHQRPASAVEFTGADFERQQKIIELLAYQNALTPRQSSSHDRRKSDFYMSVPKYLGAYTAESKEDSNQEEHPVQGRGRSSHKQFLAAKEKILYQGSDGIHEDEKEDGSYFRNYSGKRGHHVPKTQSMEDYGIYGDDDNDAEEEDEADEYKQIPAMNVMNVPHRPKIMVPRWRQNSPSYVAGVDLDKHPKGSSQEHLATSLAQNLINPGPKNNVKGRVSPIIHSGNASSKQTQEKVRNSAMVEPSGDQDIELKQVTDIKKQGETESPSRDKWSKDSENHSFMDTQHEKRNDNNIDTHEIISVSHSHFKENNHHDNSANCPKQSGNIPDTNDFLEKWDDRAQALLDGSQSYRRTESKSTTDNKFLKVSSVSASQTHQIVPEASDLKEDRSAVTSAKQDWSNLMPKDRHGPKLLTGTPEVSDNVQKTLSVPKSGGDDKHNTQTQNLIEYFQNRRFISAVSPGRDSSVDSKVSHGVQRSSTPNRVFDKDGIDIINSETIGNDDQNGDNNAAFTKQMTFSEGQASANHRKESEGQTSKGQKKSKADSDDSIIVREVNDIEEGVTQNGHSHKKQLSLVSFSMPGEPSGNRGISNLKKLEETKDSGRKDSETKDMANNITSGPSVIKPSVNFAKLQRTTSPTPLGKMSQPVGPVKIPITQDKANNSLKNMNGNSTGAETGDSLRRALSPHLHEKPVEIENQSSSLLRETNEITNASRARRSQSPNKGSADRSLSPSKGNLKDTKIPVRKKDSGPGLTLPSQSNVSKSTEDISKIKKKSAFKDSIKNLFGRKKHGTPEEEAAMHKLGEADQYL